MKLSPDSPELTAYLLGELSTDERAQVEAALRESPELRAELESLRRTSEQLSQELVAEPVVALSSAQRTALLRSPKTEFQPSNAVPAKRRAPTADISWWQRVLAWRRQLIWVAAGASALLLTLMLLPRQSPTKIRELQEIRVQETLDLAPATTPEPVKIEVNLRKEVSEFAAVKPGQDLSRPSGEVAPNVTAGVPVDSFQASADSKSSVPSLGIADNQTVDSQSFYRMDPLLARRYGLIPRGLSAAAGPTLAESASRQATLQERPVELQFAEESRYQGAVPGQRIEEMREGIDEPRGRFVAPGTESYGTLTDNPFKEVLSAPLSTFGLDVDTASYANVRRFLRDGSLPPANAVRLEELINYFRYDYPAPQRSEPFAVAIEIADSPWKEGHKLVRLGLQAQALVRQERPPANLVFLLDVSGSMEPENKLPLVKRSLRLLLERLTERDTVGIVTYAGESRIALEPTSVSTEGRTRISDVIEALRAGSGTAGGAGIVDAYRLATNRFNREWVNRVILCTDGDFNIGVSNPDDLQRLIEEKAKSGVFLSVLGYGLGNLKDSTMERLADKGNGNYAYVDSFTEARKVLSEQLDGTLVTVAKDVKVQVEFNPTRVKSYRLLGYENRALRNRDFNDDTKDAGEVGAGHQVTVLYEIEPMTTSLAGVDSLRYQARPEPASTLDRSAKTPHADELINLRLRYKAPDGDESRLIEIPINDSDREFAQASADFKFATAVAGYGMMLRDSPYKGDLTWEKVLRLAEQGLGPDREGYRAEFVDLVRRAQQLSGRPSGEQPRPRSYNSRP